METQKIGVSGIIQVIDDGVFVCTCRVYWDIFKKITPQAFVYDSNFAQKDKSECCGAIIDDRYHAPIGVLEEKDRKRKLH